MLDWDRAIVGIFFFYGLAFYSMGLALLVESGRSSELNLARSIRLLAGFGILHGVHEWIDMVKCSNDLCQQFTFPEWFIWPRLVILVTSFLALLAFGENLLQQSYRWRLTLSAWGFYMFSAVAVYLVYDLDEHTWTDALDVLARYIIGIPGALLSCLALWRQRPGFQARGMERFSFDLTLAAVAMALYGVFGQLFVARSDVFPSHEINETLFQNIFGFPIQLFRAVMAAFIAVAMIRVLRALEVENQQRLQSAEQAKQESEQRSREELTRLNTELQLANQETERLLREVQHHHARRGELLQHITAAQEAERRRIARELHDETGQALTGLAMGLRGIVMSLQEDGKFARRLTDLESIATTALGELRHLINDLRPPQLDDMGLAAALRWLVNRINERGLLQVELDIQGTPISLPSDVETTLFRITQEGLNNVIKHAKASHAWITLTFDHPIRLTVRDDGTGFDPEAAFNSNSLRVSWGLVGMQERANLINARLSIQSEEGRGTLLTIEFDQPTTVENER